MSGQVNVEVDAGSQVDLNRIMTEIREHYEALIAKNRKDLEQWYQNKVRHKAAAVSVQQSFTGLQQHLMRFCPGHSGGEGCSRTNKQSSDIPH